jgi:hypothetical protein
MPQSAQNYRLAVADTELRSHGASCKVLDDLLDIVERKLFHDRPTSVGKSDVVDRVLE